MHLKDAIGGIDAVGDTGFRRVTVDILWSIGADLGYTPYAVLDFDFTALS
jgi:hypothetical protein